MLKLIALFFVVSAMAAEVETDCRSDIQFTDFISNAESGCFVESFENGNFYAGGPAFNPSVGMKFVTREEGRNLETRPRDFLGNKSLTLFSPNGGPRQTFWPYTSSRRVSRNAYRYGNPANMRIELEQTGPGRTKVTVLPDGGGRLVVSCIEVDSASCDQASINNSSMPKAGPPPEAMMTAPSSATSTTQE